MVAVHAEDDAVGLEEILDRRPFLQELGVGAHVEREARGLGDRALHLLGGAHRHGGLCHDDQFARHVAPDLARDIEHVAQVGRAVLVRRRPHRDEDHLGAGDRAPDVGRERQALLALVPLHELLQPRLVDRDHVALQRLDLPRVHVGAGDVVPGLGEAGPHHQPDVPRPYNGNVHGTLVPSSVSPL